MLAVARARGAAAGLDQLTFELADATTWRPNAPADVVISRFGVMFFDDPVAAFANIRAGLRGGGRLVFAAWQAVLDNPWMVVPAAAVGSVLTLPAPTDPGAPGPFAFADADRVRSLLAEAGWTEVVIDAVRRPMWVGADPADAVGFFRSTRLGQEVFRSATPDQIAAAEAAAIDALGIHVTDDGVVLDGAAWVVTARA